MRVLLLLRGAPGCGKSTWIEQNGLKPYALSADEIRQLYSGAVLTADGGLAINQSNDTVVWELLYKLLEYRMQNGEFTVIDATNSKTVEMNKYKELCNYYKYRMYCVDFTGIPMEVAKQRNRMRPALKQVPDAAIEKMYARFQTQKIPTGIKVLQPDQLGEVWLKCIDLSSYERVHVIGDIHGCNTALQNYFALDGGLREQDFYIFCGDYVDRGVENAEVLRFMLSVYERKNVLFLEGNHERWLWVWANGGVSKSKEFELVTRTQLEAAGIDKKEIRKLFRRFGQCAYFRYHDKVYLVTHGGLSTLPENLTLVSTSQMIRGVGSYNDFETVENAFMQNAPENCYQIHGHRNTKHVPVDTGKRCFNLEGSVEFGGNLRAVQLMPDGSSVTVEIKNEVFRQPEEVQPAEKREKQETVGDVILSLRQNKYVQEKRFGNISSFNFTKSAFYDRIWDDQTTKARGLYINIPRQKVVARAYDKFFNINERPETKLDMLQYRLAFPVTAYVKENGFLGIVSYNEEDDSLFVTTKSNPEGDYSVWLRAMLETKLSPETLEQMKLYAKEHGVSFVFECVDLVHDPHIINYPESSLFLLDVVYNDLRYHKYEYAKLCETAALFGLQPKEKAFEIETWQEFFDWYYQVTGDDYLYNGRNIEGFVIEDTNGYMVKLKLAYYNFWKFMRSVSHETLRFGYIRRTSALTTALANQFYGWIKALREVAEDPEAIPKDIISLRELFFQSEIGKQFL